MPSEMLQGHCHSRCRIKLTQKPLKADLHHFLGARIHWNFVAFSQHFLEALFGKPSNRQRITCALSRRAGSPSCDSVYCLVLGG